MPPLVSPENAVRVPLRTDTDVVVVPDSLAGYFPPIPEPTSVPAQIEAPSTALVLVPAPVEPIKDTDYCRWTASEYIMCALALVFVACVVGIIIATVHVVSAVAAAIAVAYAFVTSVGPMVLAAGVLALVWRLAAKLSTPSAPGPIAAAVATVTAVAHPVVTVTKLAKGEPMVTKPRLSPVVQQTSSKSKPGVLERLFLGDAHSAPPAPAAVQTSRKSKPGVFGRLFLGDLCNTPLARTAAPETTAMAPAETAPARRHWWGGLTDEAREQDRRERLRSLDPRAQQWVRDLRDPSSIQAKGTYDDGSDRYCAVGIETHKHRRMSHQKMCNVFGWNFVRDVERFNDSTNATFADVATYIEDNL